MRARFTSTARTSANRPPGERRVGFVFQHYALFRHMTVFENIAFGLRVRPAEWYASSDTTIRERVHELLGLIQLQNQAGRYPSQLSGGQRQRVALARALAVEPSVLLLDEPFGALDAKVRHELRRWLRQLHDDVHITSVFVTHDQEEALEVADRVAVMNEGNIEQIGSARRSLRSSGHVVRLQLSRQRQPLPRSHRRRHDVHPSGCHGSRRLRPPAPPRNRARTRRNQFVPRNDPPHQRRRPAGEGRCSGGVGRPREYRNHPGTLPRAVSSKGRPDLHQPARRRRIFGKALSSEASAPRIAVVEGPRQQFASYPGEKLCVTAVLRLRSLRSLRSG